MTEPKAGASAGAVEPRPIMSSAGRLALRVLSDDDVLRVHTAALELLGAEGSAAAAAAESAPSRFVLGGRVPQHDVSVGAGRLWLAAGAATAGATGGPARVHSRVGVDPTQATPTDLDAACRLADALPEVGLIAGPPVRVAGETGLAQLGRCFAGTSKHIMASSVTGAAEAGAAVAMATAVAGSADELRRRPPLSLCGGTDTLDAALVFAAAGLPVAVVSDPQKAPAPAAEGGPADLAAALVRHHAGVLAGCAAVQAAAPGAPFLYAADPAAAGLPPAGPSAALFQIAAAQLAAHIGLPLVAGGLRTASHEPDWQACTQGAFAALSATASGADVSGGAGTLGGGDAFSLHQLVLDTEIFSWSVKTAAGIDVHEETIALEAIKRVGIGGNFLGQRHTRRHMRDVWRPRLLDRSMWDAWVASGREGALEKAGALADRLLTEHEVVPLGDEVSGALSRIVAESGLRDLAPDHQTTRPGSREEQGPRAEGETR
jgi:trimethylamine--corrinoid protein Co-methyltransferase